jgi:glycosyltransferase involved in cell wall biosynthesis
MTKAVFVVSKHPYGGVEDGETRITRLLLDAAREACEVTTVALSEEPGRAPVRADLVEVPKPPLRRGRLALGSALRRRSLIHLRFAPRALTDALAPLPADVIVARRVYMAQAPIDAGRVPPGDRLLVLVDVLESSVIRARRSPLRPALALEAGRTRRDELRCVRAASEAAFFSDTEIAELGAAAPPGRRLDLVLPAAEVPAALDHPVAMFVGDRRWAPNREALADLLRMWPRIVRLAPDSRLIVAGHPGRGERDSGIAGVEYTGYVDDLDELWRSAAVLLAPVGIGGGVRVKVLDAARHGVPVVASPEAIGSVGDYLPVRGVAGEAGFVEEAASLLRGRAARLARGRELFEANRELNERESVQRQVAAILVP